MSVAKKHGRLCKDQASIAVSGPSRPSFRSEDKKFPAPPRAPNKPTSPLNSRPSLAPSQVPQYTKHDLQLILKIVLEVQPPIACDQD